MATNLGPSGRAIGIESETRKIYWRTIRTMEFDTHITMVTFLR